MDDTFWVVVLATVAIALLLIGTRARRPSRSSPEDALSNIALDAEYDDHRTSAIEMVDRMNISEPRN